VLAANLEVLLMFRRILGAVAIAAVVFGAANQSPAALMSLSSGHTSPQFDGGDDPEEVDGTINFAVYDRTGGSAGDSFGIGAGSDTWLTAGGFDVTESYLYLYQVVNAGTPEEIDDLFVYTPNGYVTSMGFLVGRGFIDADGVVSVTNPFGTNPAIYGDPAGAILGVSGGGITTITGGVVPDSIGTGENVQGDDRFEVNFDPELEPPANRVSVLVGFTSTHGPGLSVAEIRDGENAFGMVMAPVPEPASMAIWSLGLAMVGGIGAWRRRRLKAAA
jgi:MYXO-CTERM domain-containing protein